MGQIRLVICEKITELEVRYFIRNSSVVQVLKRSCSGVFEHRLLSELSVLLELGLELEGLTRMLALG